MRKLLLIIINYFKKLFSKKQPIEIKRREEEKKIVVPQLSYKQAKDKKHRRVRNKIASKSRMYNYLH